MWKYSSTALVCLLLCYACSTDNTAQQTTTPPAANSPALVGSQSASGANVVQVTAKEMEFQLSKSTVPAGTVEFRVTNKGRLAHEMVVIKTDLPVDKLPLKGQRLDEDKAGKKIGEIEDDELKSGATKTLKVNLTPGKYLIVCNLPGHFQAGMKKVLTVTK